ncbi:MAG: hypothetical protein ACYDH9_20160 [Limisphaerales bacterium]
MNWRCKTNTSPARTRGGVCWIVLAALCGVALTPRAALPQSPEGRSARPAATKGTTRNDPATRPQTEVRVSRQGAELVNMAESGVEASVMKAYVENATAVEPPGAQEIIYLRRHGIAPEVISALIRRAGELREQARQAGSQEQNQAAPQAASSAAPATAPPASSPYVTPSYAPPSYGESDPVANYPQYSSPGYPAYGYPSWGYGYPWSYWYPFSFFGVVPVCFTPTCPGSGTNSTHGQGSAGAGGNARHHGSSGPATTNAAAGAGAGGGGAHSYASPRAAAMNVAGSRAATQALPAGRPFPLWNHAPRRLGSPSNRQFPAQRPAPTMARAFPMRTAFSRSGYGFGAVRGSLGMRSRAGSR